MNIYSLLEKNLKDFPDHVRIVFKDQEITRNRLLDYATNLAGGLASLGLKPGDKVAVILPGLPQVHIAYPAIWRIGAILVPIHYEYSGKEIGEILKLVQASFVITTHEKAVSICETLPEIRNSIAVIEDTHDFVSFARLYQDSGRPAPEVYQPKQSDGAVIIFTSGSSGKPKGILQTHFNFVSLINNWKNTAWAREGFPGYFSPITTLNFASYAHTAGPYLIAAYYSQMVKVIILEKFDIRLILSNIQKHKVTFFSGSPAVYANLLGYPNLKEFDFSSVKNWTVGAAAISEENLLKYEKIVGRRIYQGYGLSETVSAISVDSCDSPRRPGSVGKIAEGCEVKIVSESNATLPIGEVGEICVKGPSTTKGYLNSPEDSRKVFQGDFVHTGDLGKVDVDGFLYVLGRKSQVISQGGFKIFPQEVALAFENLSEIETVVIAGVPDPILGEIVAAFLKFKPGKSIAVDQLKAHCATRLASKKIPRLFLTVDSFPMTKTLKIDIPALVRNYQASIENTEQKMQSAPDVASTLVKLRTILSQVLKKEVEGVDNVPLMELGINSLLAVEFAIKAGERFGKNLPSTLIFSYPTLADVAKHLSSSHHKPAGDAKAGASPSGDERIAIVGVSCRLPGISTPDEFWKVLSSVGVNVSEVPAERWDRDAYYDSRPHTPGKVVTKTGGFVSDVDQFDAGFFGLSSDHAAHLDPQHRMAMELTWQAIESAGYRADALKGTQTGVYFGFSTPLEYASVVMKNDPEYELDLGYNGVGTAPSMLAGRISNFFGFNGPSMIVDTACSSSLVAVHLACQALKANQASMAVVGGVNLLLTPRSFISMSNVGVLSAAGTCRPFDAAADGTVKSEGGVVFILKRLTAALEGGDKILAVISSTAINQDGKSSSQAAPNGKAQEDLIRAALQDAGKRPDEIDYVETHGTGTVLGDAIEFNSLASVFGGDERRSRPLYLGSVKSNIGHTEATAGAAGLLKSVLCLSRRKLVGTANFKNINPNFHTNQFSFEIPRQLMDFPESAGPRTVGISSFGLSGTNCHLIVEEYCEDESTQENESKKGVLFLSARTERAVDDLIERYIELLNRNPHANVLDLCRDSIFARSRFQFSTYVLGGSAMELKEQLIRLKKTRSEGVLSFRNQRGDRSPKVCFLFAGQSVINKGVARSLYETHSEYRAAFDDCDQAVKSLINKSLKDTLFGSGDGILDDLVLSNCALCAVEYSVAKMWISLGVNPDSLVGHSLGELVAACVAGTFSVADMFRFVTERGNLVRKHGIQGGMAALSATFDEATNLVREFGAKDLFVSAMNSANRISVSGSTEAIFAFSKFCKKRGVPTKTLATAWAAHCPISEPISGDLLKVVQGLNLSSPKVRIFSTVFPNDQTSNVSKPDYWASHNELPVQFHRAIQSAEASGATVFIEMGPERTLIGLAGEILFGKSTCQYLQSIGHDDQESVHVLRSIGELNCAGLSLSASEFYGAKRTRRRIDLPTYPFQRTRFWIDPSGSTRVSEVAKRPVENVNQTTFVETIENVDAEKRFELVFERIKQVAMNSIAQDSLGPLLPDKDLTEQGLDSMTALSFARSLDRDWGGQGKISPDLIFKCRTILRLARHLNGNFEGQIEIGSGAWLKTFSSIQSPRARLICFPYAGGSARIYSNWTPMVPSGVDVCGIQLPGRWERSSEPYCDHISSAAAAVVDEILRLENVPTVLFGHSLGGLMAFETARHLLARNPSREVGLIISAAGAIRTGKSSGISLGSDFPQFIEFARKSGMLPESISNGEVEEQLARTLRADLKLAETFSLNDKFALPFAIRCICGANDSIVSEESMAAWKNRTSSSFGMRKIAGGHMFLESNRNEFFRVLLESLNELFDQVALKKIS